MTATRLLFLVAVLTVCCAGSLRATFSGLLVIPTAETVGDREYIVETDLYGEAPELGADVRLFGAEFGFGNRFECGLNYDYSKHPITTWFVDAKYLIAAGKTSAAVGFCNVGKHLPPCPYVVGKLPVGTGRLHFGAMRTSAGNNLIVGADTGFDRAWTLMADYTSGMANEASAGVNYQFNPQSGVALGALFPNAGGTSVLTLQIYFGGSF